MAKNPEAGQARTTANLRHAIKSCNPPMPRWLASAHLTTQFEPLKIALIYAVFATLWIITSDSVLHHVAPDRETANFVSTIKGGAFVLVTAGMLWILVYRLVSRIRDSEAELRDSEQQARAIFNSVTEAIFIHDPRNGRILDVNETACRMLGYSRDELLNLNVEDFSSGVEPYTQKNVHAIIQKAMRERVATFEWHSRHRDGHLFWSEVSARPASIGNELRLLVTVRNIDGRKDANDQIRKLSRAVEQSPVSVVITNLKGEISYVNPATCHLTGYTEEELIGKNPRVLKSGHTPPEEYQQLWRTIRSGGEWRGEFHNVKKNGERYWEAVLISPVVNEAGQITHFLAVKEDITKRKRAEEKLKHQDDLLREVGEIANIGGWDFDPVTGNGTWSPEVARIHDLDGTESQTVVNGLSFFPGESRVKLETALAEAVTRGTPYDLELEFVSAKGRKKWVRAISKPIVKDGRVVLVRGTLQDITDRKLADEALRASRSKLRALLASVQKAREDERTRIAREVHDVLGQLLTGMKMDLSWLDRRIPRIDNEALRADLRDKLAEAHHLADSMLESIQKISSDLRPSILDNLGLSAALRFEARKFSDRTGIACEFSKLPSDIGLPPDSSTHVFRIFQEILTNVARHSSASAVISSLTEEDDKLTLTVKDNGCGMSTEALKKPSSLGLLGMKERAALIGGRIRIHGSPDKGTTVRLTIARETNQT